MQSLKAASSLQKAPAGSRFANGLADAGAADAAIAAIHCYHSGSMFPPEECLPQANTLQALFHVIFAKCSFDEAVNTDGQLEHSADWDSVYIRCAPLPRSWVMQEELKLCLPAVQNHDRARVPAMIYNTPCRLLPRHCSGIPC